MVKPEVVNDEKMVLIARDIVKKIEDELEYPGQIKVNLIRRAESATTQNKQKAGVVAFRCRNRFLHPKLYIDTASG